METIIVKAEEREEIVEETFANQKTDKAKIQEDNSSQMSLYLVKLH